MRLGGRSNCSSGLGGDLRAKYIFPTFTRGIVNYSTGCITWFSKLENDVENVNKTTNPIGIFTAWNIAMVI